MDAAGACQCHNEHPSGEEATSSVELGECATRIDDPEDMISDILAPLQPSTTTRRIVFCSVILVSACGTTHGVDGGEDASADSGRALDAELPPDASGGPDASVDGGVDLGPIVRAFCVRRLELLCAGRRDCCESTDAARRSCRNPDQIQTKCAEVAGDPALRGGTLAWNEVEAARYLAELEAAMAVCGPRDRLWSYGEALTGTLDEGEDCTPHRPLLDSLGGYRCRGDLRCELTGTIGDYVGRCARPGELGDSCNHDCRVGLYCNSGATVVSNPFWGRCEVLQDAGECFSDYACSSTFCRVTVSCYDGEASETWCAVAG